MKITTAKTTMMKITAGLILLPDEEARGGDNSFLQSEEGGERILGSMIASLLWQI